MVYIPAATPTVTPNSEATASLLPSDRMISSLVVGVAGVVVGFGVFMAPHYDSHAVTTQEAVEIFVDRSGVLYSSVSRLYVTEDVFELRTGA